MFNLFKARAPRRQAPPPELLAEYTPAAPAPIEPPEEARREPGPGYPASWLDQSRKTVKGCYFLNSNLVFGYDGVCACCVLPPGATESPPSYFEGIVAAGLSPSELVDMIVRKRDEFLTKLQNEGYKTCEMCSFYKEYPVEEVRKQTYAFDKLTMNYIEGCTLKCTYCYQAEPGYVRNKPKQLYQMPAVLRDMLDRGILDPHSYTFWAGGEPTLGDDFDEAVELLSERGGTQCLNTNALRLSKNVVEILKQRRNFALVCSVDAGTPETYARIKGFNVYERVMKNLATYAATGGSVTAKYIVLDENLGELMDFGRQAVAAGIKDYLFDFDNRVHAGVRPRYSDEMFETIENYVHFIRAEGLSVGWSAHSRGMMSPAEIERIDAILAMPAKAA